MPLLTDFDWRIKYDPDEGTLIEQFYLTALACAQRYDRTTGYFSATALAIAARGVEGREYPWGKGYESGRANVNETFGRRVGDWFIAQTTAVGVYPQGASSEGVLDLSGNVWEWCLNKYEPPEQIQADTSGESRVLRGGSWGDAAGGGARGSRRSRANPDYRADSSGFRVVSSAPIA